MDDFDPTLNQLLHVIDVDLGAGRQQQAAVGPAHCLRQPRTGFETQG
jgi:hypothetical protein